MACASRMNAARRKTPIAFNAMDRQRETPADRSRSPGSASFRFAYVIFNEPAFARPVLCPAAWLGSAVAIGALVMFRLTHKALGRNWSVSRCRCGKITS
jgi:hypothetical protein